MKKRIFALLMALAFIASAMLLSACKQESEQSSDETSELFNPSLKEIFESALRNKLAIDEENELIEKLKELTDVEMQDVAGVTSAKVTKLTLNDFDLSGIGSITLDGTIAYDADSTRINGDLLLSAMGEKPTFALPRTKAGLILPIILVLTKSRFISTRKNSWKRSTPKRPSVYPTQLRLTPKFTRTLRLRQRRLSMRTSRKARSARL